MPFTVNDVRDLVQLLEQHPEWRAEVRRLVLTEELLTLPAVVRELADAQREMQAELRALAQQVRALVEAQGRTEDRLDALVTVQARMERWQDRIQDDLAELKGNNLRCAYRENPYGHLGQLIRRARRVPHEELAGLLEDAEDRGQLGPKEVADVLQVAAVVRGRRQEDGGDVYLVVEVSWGVGANDVERAARRAAVLARMGLPVWPVAAGDHITPGTRRRAAANDVALVRRGQWLREPLGNGNGSPP